MPNLITNNGAALLLAAGVSGSPGMGAALKWMLVGPGYVPDQDDVYASTASAFELSVSGYTGGYGGSGRRSFSMPSIVADNTNNRAYLTGDMAAWTALGACTIVHALLVYETGGSDGTSPIIAAVEASATLVGGEGFNLVPGALIGFLRLNC